MYPTLWRVEAEGPHRATSGLSWATVCCLCAEDRGSVQPVPVSAGCVSCPAAAHCQDTGPALSQQEHGPQGRDSPTAAAAAAAGFPAHLLQVDEDISYGRGLSSCHFGSGPKGLGKISTLLFHRQAPSKPGEWHNLWREGRTRECRGKLLATALKPLAPDPEVTSAAPGEPLWQH